ncbi:MAG TPA: response regulator [Allosphingosinicella sp.]|jgi:DNA-binding response OmpR family regulator
MSRKVLLCDDDPLLVDLVQYRLAARGWEVIVARDGGEAMARLAEEAPDAIVLDAMMPVVDGYEVLRRLREDPATAATPVIMLTARKQETDVLRALDLGASDYMVKPFIPEELVARLARLAGEQAR